MSLDERVGMDMRRGEFNCLMYAIICLYVCGGGRSVTMGKSSCGLDVCYGCNLVLDVCCAWGRCCKVCAEQLALQ